MNSHQKGFTLIEMIIVVVILGVLAIVVAAQFGSGAANGAKSQAVWQVSRKIADNWNALNLVASTPSTDVTGNPLLAAAATPLDILVGGSTYVAAAYQNSYTQSGVKMLSDSMQLVSAHNYKILDYPIDVTGGGASPLSIVISSVPDEVILPLVQKYGSGATTLAASDATNAVIQYGTATAGSRTITIFRR